MIVRVVQMHFQSEAVEQMRERLLAQAPKVRAFPGCLYLAIHQDAENPEIFYSISHWDSPEALEVYRQSVLFRDFWAELRACFAHPARAFTLGEPILSL